MSEKIGNFKQVVFCYLELLAVSILLFTNIYIGLTLYAVLSIIIILAGIAARNKGFNTGKSSLSIIIFGLFWPLLYFQVIGAVIFSRLNFRRKK